MLLIYAYDAQYCGLHGMFEYYILEEDNIKMAESIGTDLSFEVIQEFGLEEELVEEEASDEEMEEFYQDLIAYEIYKINNLGKKTIDELYEEIFQNGIEDFIKDNCILYKDA